MSFEIVATPRFRRDIKRLTKKYPSIKQDFSELLNNLERSPNQGIALGNQCFKIRLAIASKGKGKSGGARVITYVFIEGEKVFLLTIYDKSEKENINDKELQELISQIL